MHSKCQSCGSRKCLTILDLGKQPICNKFLNSRKDFKRERLYPLELVFCQKCKLVQLGYVPPAKEVFGTNFNYLSSSTPDRVAYFGTLAKTLINNLGLKNGDFVLDIGSNDGSFLKQFKQNGIETVLGVDPAPKPSKIANDSGIDTITGKFEDKTGAILNKTNGRIRLITAFNVMAHTDTIHPFLKNVKKLLARNDADFISISHYLPCMLDKLEYDTIYHEHARYYSITAMANLLREHGLFIYDAEVIDMYGGSILVYAKNRRTKKTQRILRLLAREKSLNHQKPYREFSKEIEDNREKLRQTLLKMKAEGKHIVGIGAPMKSSTLLNYCGIDDTMLDYITELNTLKIGTYTPGTHIKVVSESNVFKDMPDACLILSWNVADRIMTSFRKKGYKGVFIMPIPKVKIVRR